MTTAVIEQVKSIASDIFGLPLDRISDNTSPENVESWDSTKHLTFVLALEETFQFELSPEETERIRSVGEAAKVIQGKLLVSGG